MLKIQISVRSLKKIERYLEKYSSFYEWMYSDTWIINESAIRETYEQEAISRFYEIEKLLKDKLSHWIITYQNNESIIRWRSKILIVSFKDIWDSRIITDLEIR